MWLVSLKYDWLNVRNNSPILACPLSLIKNANINTVLGLVYICDFFPADHEWTRFYRQHNVKTAHVTHIPIHTIDTIIIPPISYVFAVPAWDMLWISAVREIEFDTIMLGITRDFLLWGNLVVHGLNLVARRYRSRGYVPQLIKHSIGMSTLYYFLTKMIKVDVRSNWSVITCLTELFAHWDSR